jgi:predicted AAA+ superfamily ATPase
MSNVRILEGTYKIRGNDTSVAGIIFPLVDDFRFGSNGGFVTVDARNIPGFPDRNIKIRVPNDKAYEVTGDHQINVPKETDEQTIERLRERFDMLEDMTRACKKGDVRAMIVSGPPGVGKSHGVEKVLAKHDMITTLANTQPKYVIVKGAMSPLGLYMKLYNYSAKDNVVVFDDCDSIFQDELSLNILKAALDSKKTRKIFWNTDSRALRSEGIPDQFEFKGSAVFITNLKFEKVKGKLREHLEALESRCHYIDLTIDTDREKMLRIKQIVADGMLDEYAFEGDVQEEILDFVTINKDRLRELSLRTVLKIADLAKAFPTKWESMSENTVMRRA